MDEQKLRDDVPMTVEYRRSDGTLSHSYKEVWEQTELHCPNCGVRGVWRDSGAGDYYVGEQHLCTACSSTFYLPGGISEAEGAQNEQRLAAIGKGEPQNASN